MRSFSNTALILARGWRALRVPVISLFILFHTCALVLWISAPFPLYWPMVSVIRPYVCYFGFWNQWQMFAHPKAFNIHLTANVTLADGQVVNWDFPRMEKLDYVARAFEGRYRCWAHEYVNEERNASVRPEECNWFVTGPGFNRRLEWEMLALRVSLHTCSTHTTSVRRT